MENSFASREPFFIPKISFVLICILVSPCTPAGEITFFPIPRGAAAWAGRVYRAVNANEKIASDGLAAIFIANFGQSFGARAAICSRALDRATRPYSDARVRHAYRNLLLQLDSDQALRVREFVDQLYGSSEPRLREIIVDDPWYPPLDLAGPTSSRIGPEHWSRVFQVSPARVRQAFHVAEAVLYPRQLKAWRAFLTVLFG